MDQLGSPPWCQAQLLRLQVAPQVLPGLLHDLPMVSLEERIPDAEEADTLLLLCLVQSPPVPGDLPLLRRSRESLRPPKLSTRHCLMMLVGMGIFLVGYLASTLAHT